MDRGSLLVTLETAQARKSLRRCSRPPRRVAGSPRTASPSTRPWARSPARMRSPSDPPGHRRGRHRGVRPRLRRLPAGRPMHRLLHWPHHRHRSLRSRTRPRPRRPGRPGLDHRLQGHPPESGTQDRPPDAPPARRPPRPRQRPHQSRRRLLPARRRGQPRAPRRARPAPRRRKLGRGSRPEADERRPDAPAPGHPPHQGQARHRNRPPRQQDSPEPGSAHDHARAVQRSNRSTSLPAMARSTPAIYGAPAGDCMW